MLKLLLFILCKNQKDVVCSHYHQKSILFWRNIKRVSILSWHSKYYGPCHMCKRSYDCKQATRWCLQVFDDSLEWKVTSPYIRMRQGIKLLKRPKVLKFSYNAIEIFFFFIYLFTWDNKYSILVVLTWPAACGCTLYRTFTSLVGCWFLAHPLEL